MNYPYKRREAEIRAGNSAFGGKKVSPITEEALAYMRLLMSCDRLVSPYIYIRMAHIFEKYTETMKKRESLLLHCVKYDSMHTGSKDPEYLLPEVYMHYEQKAMEKAEAEYNRYVLPVIRVHHALLDNAETMFCERKKEGKIVEIAVANSLTVPMARAEYGMDCGVEMRHTWTRMVRKKALCRKNEYAYLCFPKFSEQDIDALCEAGYQNLDDELIKRYCHDEGMGMAELEEYKLHCGHRFNRDFSNGLRAKYLGWSTWSCIKKMGEEVPDAMSAVEMFRAGMNRKTYERALSRSY